MNDEHNVNIWLISTKNKKYGGCDSAKQTNNIWGRKDMGKKMLLEGGLKCFRLSCFFVLVPYVY